MSNNLNEGNRNLSPLEQIIDFGTSPLMTSAANYSQITSLILEIATLSNTELLKRVEKMFESQNSGELNGIYSLAVKIILQNEEIIRQNKEIIDIISVLKKYNEGVVHDA